MYFCKLCMVVVVMVHLLLLFFDKTVMSLLRIIHPFSTLVTTRVHLHNLI